MLSLLPVSLIIDSLRDFTEIRLLFMISFRLEASYLLINFIEAFRLLSSTRSYRDIWSAIITSILLDTLFRLSWSASLYSTVL